MQQDHVVSTEMHMQSMLQQWCYNRLLSPLTYYKQKKSHVKVHFYHGGLKYPDIVNEQEWINTIVSRGYQNVFPKNYSFCWALMKQYVNHMWLTYCFAQQLIKIRAITELVTLLHLFQAMANIQYCKLGISKSLPKIYLFMYLSLPSIAETKDSFL